MPLLPQSIYPGFHDAVKSAATEAMKFYHRSLDPNDNATVTVSPGFGQPVVLISLDTSTQFKKVDLNKASQVFGKAFAAKVVPVVVSNMDTYIKTATVTTQPGISLLVGTSAGATIAPGIGSIS